MSSASSSIETPALTRRTFDWESTSLLRGMSREDDRVIFFDAAWAMVFTPRRAAGSLSLGLLPVTKRSAALFL